MPGARRAGGGARDGRFTPAQEDTIGERLHRWISGWELGPRNAEALDFIATTMRRLPPGADGADSTDGTDSTDGARN